MIYLVYPYKAIELQTTTVWRTLCVWRPLAHRRLHRKLTSLSPLSEVQDMRVPRLLEFMIYHTIFY